MRWQGRRQSENVEDRRSMSGPTMAGGGLLGVVLVIIVIIMGGDPRPLLRMMQNNPPGQPAGPDQVNPAEDEVAQFVAVVLADTEDVWTEQFRQLGRPYVKPRLILFRRQVDSACGFQSAATGPFYCPLDQQLYIDLNFFNELKQRFKAPGDFAQAYVIAHEVGHHVQKLLGTSDEVHALQQRASEAEANELSVRLELQADFFAGVWAHHAQQNWNILEPGDIDEALRAATAIGDDQLQMKSRGYVVPESFTHGTSEQRGRWFARGLKGGDLHQGDTFSVRFDRL